MVMIRESMLDWPSKREIGLSALWSEVKVAQLCPTLCDPIDYTAHELLQARILEWLAIPFSQYIIHFENQRLV